MIQFTKDREKIIIGLEKEKKSFIQVYSYMPETLILKTTYFSQDYWSSITAVNKQHSSIFDCLKKESNDCYNGSDNIPI